MAITLVTTTPLNKSESKDITYYARWSVTTGGISIDYELAHPCENISLQAYGLTAGGTIVLPTTFTVQIFRSLDGAVYDSGVALLSISNADVLGTVKDSTGKAFRFLRININATFVLGTAVSLEVAALCYRNR